jgi:hypothetical protein
MNKCCKQELINLIHLHNMNWITKKIIQLLLNHLYHLQNHLKVRYFNLKQKLKNLLTVWNSYSLNLTVRKEKKFHQLEELLNQKCELKDNKLLNKQHLKECKLLWILNQNKTLWKIWKYKQLMMILNKKIIKTQQINKFKQK